MTTVHNSTNFSQRRMSVGNETDLVSQIKNLEVDTSAAAPDQTDLENQFRRTMTQSSHSTTKLAPVKARRVNRNRVGNSVAASSMITGGNKVGSNSLVLSNRSTVVNNRKQRASSRTSQQRNSKSKCQSQTSLTQLANILTNFLLLFRHQPEYHVASQRLRGFPRSIRKTD